jgi:hypothetical protein
MFMRLQLCQMVHAQGNVYNLDSTYQAWYKIEEGSMSPTTDESLSGTDYLNSFSYEAEPGSEIYDTLANQPTVYVRNLTYPWESEIYQMFIDNGAPEDAAIHFAACSFVEPPLASNVTFPHGNVMYLSVNGTPLLDNDTSYICVFQNKGVDNATLCPPNCGEYIG